MKTFNDLQFNPMVDESFYGLDAIQAIETFPNGYGASVVRHRFSYGGNSGLYELAILKDGDLCYETPITNDVCGHLTKEDVTDLLEQIQNLPNNVE
jgi:hypothetical protein